jgi:hypothetical protein
MYYFLYFFTTVLLRAVRSGFIYSPDFLEGKICSSRASNRLSRTLGAMNRFCSKEMSHLYSFDCR